MKTENQIKEYVQQVLLTNRFAVLATESQHQPYTSFIAITAINDFTELVFATYKNTNKYTNLTNNEKVSILFEYRNEKENSIREITILTAYGKANEVKADDSDEIQKVHLLQHKEMYEFIKSKDCALFRVKVEKYQLVLGIEDIYWWNIK